jgi:hypothetical protein
MSGFFFGKAKENHMKEDFLKDDNLFTSSAAARFIRKSEGTVRSYVTTGKLPCIRTSTGVRLFRKSDLEKFISKNAAA